jgi:hypothetical protein
MEAFDICIEHGFYRRENYMEKPVAVCHLNGNIGLGLYVGKGERPSLKSTCFAWRVVVGDYSSTI